MATDPLDALRLPARPLAPRPAFALELRDRIASRLAGESPTIEAGPGRRHVPVSVGGETTMTVTPYLSAADALAAIAFYQDVFGAELAFPPFIGPDGRVGHSELRIGGTTIMLASTYPEELVIDPLEVGGTTVQLRLEVPDADAVFDRAVQAGATALRPVSDQPYGERAGKIRDPFGHNWFISTVVEQLSAEELNQRLEPLGFVPADAGDPGEAAADPSVAVAGPHQPDRRLGPTDPGQLFYFTFEVADGARAEAFFRHLFDWEIMAGSQPGGYHIANPTPPGGIAGGAAQTGVTLYFRVADIQAAVARVRQLGGQADDPVLWASGWSAACRDDQGTPFTLSEPAEGY